MKKKLFWICSIVAALALSFGALAFGGVRTQADDLQEDNYVCEVTAPGGNTYKTTSVSDAVADSRFDDGYTIKLLKDSTDSVIQITKGNSAANAITLDLNGCTLTINPSAVGTINCAILVKESCYFVLTDSSENKTGKITALQSDSISKGSGVWNDGHFTMNAGTITGFSSDKGGGVYNSSHGTFTLNGGTIDSCNASSMGGGVYNSTKSSSPPGSSFIMNGGTIQNCTATGDKTLGGGVYNDHAFTFNGGSITGCTAGLGGGGIYTVDRLYLYGGSVSGCKADDPQSGGGGIKVVQGQNNHGIFVKGNPVVKGNTVNGNPNNLFLASDGNVARIENGNYLTDGAELNITKDYGSSYILVASGDSSLDIRTYFHSDNADYTVIQKKVDNETQIIFDKNHQHSWTYSDNENLKINATCPECGKAVSATMTLPENGEYSGFPFVASMNCAEFVEATGKEPEILYHDANKEPVTDTKKPGTYTATMSLAAGDNNYTVSGDFTISPKTAKVVAEDASKIYGTADPVSFTYKFEDILEEDKAKLSATLSREAGENVKEGGYAITVDAVAGDASGNYNFTKTAGVFTINPKDISDAEITLVGDILFANGKPQTQKISTVTLGDTVLTDADFVLSDNVETKAGTYALTVTGKGNYTGTANKSWVIIDPNVKPGEDGKIDIGDGNFEIKVDEEKDIPKVDIKTKPGDLIKDTSKEVIDAEFMSKVANGAEGKIVLTVKPGDKDDKDLEKRILEAAPGYNIETLVDITMKVVIDNAGDHKEFGIIETDKPISLGIEAPRKTDDKKYELGVVRDRKVDKNYETEKIKETQYDKESNKISLENDKFSTFAIVSKEIPEEPKTGDEGNLMLLTVIMMIALLCTATGLITYKCARKH